MKRRDFDHSCSSSGRNADLHAFPGPIRYRRRRERQSSSQVLLEADAKVISAACAGFSDGCYRAGATEAGVVIYIDRQLAGPYGSDKYRYTKGRGLRLAGIWTPGKETPRDVYRAGIASLAGFEALTPAQQDDKLRSIEKPPSFRCCARIRLRHVLHPMHGGNAGLIGWQLIGFPGPRMSYRENIDKYTVCLSAEAPQPSTGGGHPVQGWEEEKDT